MKNILILLLGLILIGLILMVSPVYAFEFDNVKTFYPSYGDYGKIEIVNLYGFGGKIAEYTLEKNSNQCLINCYAEGTAKLYNEAVLFSDLKFYDKRYREKQLKDYKIYIEESYDHSYEINTDTTDCNNIALNGSKYCTTTITGKKTITNKLKRWVEYTYKTLPAGSYKWRIEAKKDLRTSIDWVFLAHGKSLDNWAWWDTSYNYKKVINLTNNNNSILTNYTVFINWTFFDKNKADCSDLRFTDSTETTELYFNRENYTAGVYCIFAVKVPTMSASSVTQIYAYYNNSLAVDGSNFKQAFIFGDDYSTDTTAEYTNDDCDTVIISGGILNISDAGDCQYYPNSQKISNNYIIESRFASHYTLAGNQYHGIIGLFNPASNTGYAQNIEQDRFVITKYGLAELNQSVTPGILPSQYILMSLSFMGTGNINATYKRLDGSLWSWLRSSDNAYSSGYYGYSITNGGAYTSILVDWFRVRQYISQTPSIAFGTEEASSVTPVLTFNSPVNYYNSTSQLITINCSATNLMNTGVINLSLYLPATIRNLTVYNTTAKQNLSLQVTYNLTEGNYNFTCVAYNENNEFNTNTTRFFRVHFTNPSISIKYPIGLIDNLVNGQNYSLNWTISEQGQDLNTHIINCSYIYNGVQTYLNKTNCINNNFTIFTYIDGVNNITMTVTDDIGLIGTNVTNWGYKTKFNGYTYSNITTEGNYENFRINITLNSSLQVSTGYLNYNNTNHLGSFLRIGNDVIGSTSIIIDNVNAISNLSFFWNITFDDGSTILYPVYNQTVLNLNIDDCTTHKTVILNFTIFDEETQDVLNLNNLTSLEVAINITDQTSTNTILNYSGYKNQSSFLICISTNLTASSSYRLNALAKYSSEFYATEYYNIVNATLNVNNTNRNISLYDLNLNDSTEFQLTFTGSDFLPVENALVYVYRQYVAEDRFKIVELPKTDSNGQTVLHLVRNNVIYNIVIIKDGVVLGTFENLIAFCQDFTIGNCKIELNAFQSTEEIYDYNTALGITFTEPSINTTSGLVSFNFLTVDGTSKNVTMTLIRNDFRGNNTICSTGLISTGGTLQCFYNPNAENTTIYLAVYVDNEIIYYSTIDIDNRNFGTMGYLFLFIMMLSFMLMFSNSKTGVLLSVLFAFVGGIGLGVTNDTIIGKGSGGLWLMVVIVIAIYKLNKDRVP